MNTSFHPVIIPPTEREEILILLHGTGGDEGSLVEMGKELAPGAGIISPRGQSREEGVNRWFRRFAEGLFDLADLESKTIELALYLKGEIERQRWEDRPLALLGYSNGANMAASLLLSGLVKARKAALLRPMLPFEPEILPSLVGTRVLLAVGQRDQICLPSQGLALEEVLVRAGASTEVFWAPAGHGLTQEDLERSRALLAT